MQRARLTRYGLLSVNGDDARDFLHAQLTNDIRSLAPGRAAPVLCTGATKLSSSPSRTSNVRVKLSSTVAARATGMRQLLIHGRAAGETAGLAAAGAAASANRAYCSRCSSTDRL